MGGLLEMAARYAASLLGQRFLLSLVFLCLLSPSWAAANLPTLTKISQIRHLTTEQAGLGYPVKIRGVITNDVPSPEFVIQDSASGIYVLGNKSFVHRLGDVVELEGVTEAGGFAPVVREKNLRILGKGPLPKARLYSLGELSAGQMDSQWVKLKGVVHSVSIDQTSWHEPALDMNLSANGGQFKVRVPIFSSQVDPSSWVGHEVAIEGVCGSLSNVWRQLVGLMLYVPRLSFIKIEGKVKEASVSALLRFSPDSATSERVRVQGVVSYQERGKAVYLQSSGRGLRVLSQQDTVLEPGDLVEALGFPVLGESEPVLEDATLRRLGHQEPPIPVELEVKPPFERYDGALVVANAILLDTRMQQDGLNLLLELNGFSFNALLPNGSATERLLAIPAKSQLRVTGVCLVRNGGPWHYPKSFQILVRSPEEIAVTHTPSWWNVRHSLWLLAVLAAVLFGALAWLVVLRGKLSTQVELYRQKLRGGAILEERNRIARELHDTLEQDMAGITMQLDLAADCFEKSAPIAQRAIETARNMSRHSMMEARRSVWDLRCHLLENGDLVYALKQVAELLSRRDGIKIDVQVCGVPSRLTPSLELNLLRIGQEAMTNAVKHAHAGNIVLELRYEPGSVQLRVSDDGIGFVPSESSLSNHFGLLDMRERAQAIGSEIQIASGEGSGTRIELEVVMKS
jgi:signal transduction histidine kinase